MSCKLILTIVALAAALATAGLGLADKYDKLNEQNNRLTGYGWLLLLVALIAFGAEVCVRFIDDRAVQEAIKIKSAFEGAYEGWVKVGRYDGKGWSEEYVKFRDRSRINVGDIGTVGALGQYYVKVHGKKPEDCGYTTPDIDHTAINQLAMGTAVQVVMAPPHLSCTVGPKAGSSEVWVKIKPSR